MKQKEEPGLTMAARRSFWTLAANRQMTQDEGAGKRGLAAMALRGGGHRIRRSGDSRGRVSEQEEDRQPGCMEPPTERAEGTPCADKVGALVATAGGQRGQMCRQSRDDALPNLKPGQEFRFPRGVRRLACGERGRLTVVSLA
jgi:hypothetical protein